MRCPWCDGNLDIPESAYCNADTFGTSNVVKTKCCDRPVTVTPVRTYQVQAYIGSENTDDWGNNIKNKEKIS